jgi:hypothetical protein
MVAQHLTTLPHYHNDSGMNSLQQDVARVQATPSFPALYAVASHPPLLRALGGSPVATVGIPLAKCNNGNSKKKKPAIQQV